MRTYKKEKLDEHVEWLDADINRELFYDEPVNTLKAPPPEIHNRRSLGLLSGACEDLSGWLLSKGLVSVLSDDSAGWSDIYAGFWGQYAALLNMTKAFEVTTHRNPDPTVLPAKVAYPLCCAMLFQESEAKSQLVECTFRQPRMITSDPLGFIRFAAWITGVEVYEQLPEPEDGPWRDLMRGQASINEKLACDLIDRHRYYTREDIGEFNPIFNEGEDLLFPVELIALSRKIPALGQFYRAMDFGPFDGRVWDVPPASEIAETEELKLLKRAIPR